MTTETNYNGSENHNFPLQVEIGKIELKYPLGNDENDTEFVWPKRRSDVIGLVMAAEQRILRLESAVKTLKSKYDADGICISSGDDFNSILNNLFVVVDDQGIDRIRIINENP